MIELIFQSVAALKLRINNDVFKVEVCMKNE